MYSAEPICRAYMMPTWLLRLRWSSCSTGIAVNVCYQAICPCGRIEVQELLASCRPSYHFIKGSTVIPCIATEMAMAPGRCSRQNPFSTAAVRAEPHERDNRTIRSHGYRNNR